MLAELSRLMNLTEEEITNHPRYLVNVFDPEHRILFWNKQCETFFGINEQKALGKMLEDVIPSTRSNSKMIRLEEALSGKDVYVADDKFDNCDCYYSQLVLPLKNESGKVIAAVNIVKIPEKPGSFENQSSDAAYAKK